MATDPNQQGPTTVTDEEWAQMMRETQGDKYPGDAEVQRERSEFQQEIEAAGRAEAQPPTETPAPAPAAEPAQAKEWNAREWLNEAFKDDPTFKDLSAEDMARLETMANEKHAEFAGELQDWAAEKGAEWSGEMKDALRDGLASNPDTRDFFDSRLADGDFSEADQAALKETAKDMTPAEGAGVVRPIVAELHEIQGELIDGVEMIADHAIDDVHDIVEARAEMPGGDGEPVQKLLHDLEEAPDKVHDALNWEREQADMQFEKVDDRLELIEAGTDPRDIPPDTDTYQVDPNADANDDETEAA